MPFIMNKRKLLGACLLAYAHELTDKQQVDEKMVEKKRRLNHQDFYELTDEPSPIQTEEEDLQIQVIPCAEIKTELPDTPLHTVEYNYDPLDPTSHLKDETAHYEEQPCKHCINMQSQVQDLQLEIMALKKTIEKRDQILLEYLVEIKDLIAKEDAFNIKCNTLEDFMKLETFLEDPINNKRFIRQISLLGGNTCRAFLQNALRNIFIDEVAERFSLCGRGAGPGIKRTFETTKLFEALIAACTEQYPNTNAFKMRKAISDWLNHARERISRR